MSRPWRCASFCWKPAGATAWWPPTMGPRPWSGSVPAGVDLVLSDLVMPHMDGNEMVRRMKEIAPEVPMILISGSVKAYDHGNRADAFLPKGTSTPGEMLERIRVMIARKRGPKRSFRPVYGSPDAATFDPVAHAIAS
jgi:DNA-binding response OmpR family regulator